MKSVVNCIATAVVSLLVAAAPSFAETSGESAAERCVGKVRLRGTIYDLQAAELQPGIAEILDEIAKTFLERCPQKLLIIEVHASELPTADLNQRLTELRAHGVRFELAKRGIPEGQMLPVGMGSSKPVATAGDPEALNLNRRVTFRVAD
jgi:outer membrane protein OmpA-like peptidoglycan-associated protein